ncbi:MAG: hypothetical protein G01um101425_767 [Candidatus Peregrinibacteria bacterium Gr01-1014_25]|nr:MAG: hypothetical protein G01um101425_767 [Candidatus Peregrinibacteria bacterium Gr01-1014_25]
MKLEGTQSLITGASSGMGLAVAERFVQKGSKVHSFDAQVPLKEIDGITSHSVDVRDPEQVARGMSDVTGKLNVLFNNAGVLARGGLFDVSHDQFRKMLEVNALGSWLTLKTALDQDKLVEGATIIQMCSTVGGPPGQRMSAPKVRPYSLSKGLVHEMIGALRADRPDLRVKAIYPGAVKTPMTMAGFASEEEYDKQALANWGVVSTADDVADRIMLLLESEADNLVWDPARKEYVFE